METGNSKIENGKPKSGETNPVFHLEFPVSIGLPEERPNLKYILIAAAAIVVIVAVIIVVSRLRPASAPAAAVLTPEQNAYLASIEFTGAKMSAATNFLGQRVIYLDAEVANRGTRAVKQVELQMEFTDVLGQVILRDRARIFPPASLPLKPGETRAFQLFFDHMPAE